jgi:hypothetical protein
MQQASWRRMTVLALCSLAMGLYMSVFYDPRLQAEADLLQASGQLNWVKTYRYGLRFALQGPPQVFDFHRNSGSSEKVKKALETAGEKLVLVRYSKDTHGPVYSDDEYHDVWTLQIGSQVIRSYPEVLAAETDNAQKVVWLGWAFVCGGIYFAYVARKSYRIIKRNSQFHHLFPWS